MAVLSINNMKLSFGTKEIISNASFLVEEGDKVGIVGVNGAGKTTILKIILGQILPDEGDILLSRGTKIGYLSQSPDLDSNNTIFEEMMVSMENFLHMERMLKNLELKIETEKNQEILEKYAKEYSKISENYNSLGGYYYESRIKGVLKGLGIHESEWNRQVSTLSGGQKTRLSLAKLFVEESDLILLDEPTNHLDVDATEWLENFIRESKKTFIIVSHDRYFLDAITNKIIDVENCKVKIYNGNYTLFVKKKKAEREIDEKHYENQQKEIARLEAFIEQQRRWNREKNIIAAESRQKAIDRMQKYVKPEKERRKIAIKFGEIASCGYDILNVEKLSKKFGNNELFKDINFRIVKNERVFLVGGNGTGKTTLLNIIGKKYSQDNGKLDYGQKVQIGFYDQEQSNLDYNGTILEEIYNSQEKISETDARTSLSTFLFFGDDVYKKISLLSGGEKSRVSLLKLVLSKSNFLLLDEPTNHLDLVSREILEEALDEYQGTLLVVSHDRYFINKLASRVLYLKNKKIYDILGNYDNFIEYKNDFIQADESKKKSIDLDKKQRILLQEQKKEAESNKKRNIKKFKNTEIEIEEIEKRLKIISNDMCEFFSDHLKVAELFEEEKMLKIKLENLYEVWEELSNNIE